MPELELQLAELGRGLDWPPTPDLASAVRPRLSRRRTWQRPVAIAFAVVVVLVGAVLAVPPARSAILDWLGLRAVTIVQVDELPPVPARTSLDLGRPVSLEEARAQNPWLRVPEDRPDGAYVRGEVVTLLWGTPDDVRLLLAELRGRAYIEKLIGPNADVVPVTVDGDPGAWIAAPHVVMIKDRRGQFREDQPRLAGKTLLWQHGAVTLRLEGDLSKEDALRIARSAR
jgi:hypothetical protein